MRFEKLYIVAIAAALLSAPSPAQELDDTLKIYAVHIQRFPKQSWRGEGVYLGRGLVLTAAHVAGLWFWRWPRVEIGGAVLPTRVVKDGHFYGVDLTLLSVNEQELPVSLGLRLLPFCKGPPRVNAPVIVATPEGVARSSIMSPTLLPEGLNSKYKTVIRYVAETGNSGAGVFDASTKCLLGIITSKISQPEITHRFGRPILVFRDIAKYFVPAAEISDFIPSNLRF